MESLERYISEFSTPEDELLKEVQRATHLNVVQPRMVSGHTQGNLLRLLTASIRPVNVLEIGTFTGYSTLCIAAGLEPGASIHTTEVNDELESLSSGFFDRSPYRDRIVPHIGSALDIAPRLGLTFDMVFIDGDKREYSDYLDMLMGEGRFTSPLVRSGTVILADNILWYGKVVEQAPNNDRYTKGIQEFNRKVASHPRLDNVILPVRDGINYIRVID